MPIPYNTNTNSAYWGQGEAPRDEQNKYKLWTTDVIPMKSDGTTPYWVAADKEYIIWISPDELYDI